MALIPLETYRHLFRDEASLEAFVGVLEAATQEDDTPLVTFKDRHVVTALSPQVTERFLSDRILRRFVEMPELLDTFIQRLKNLKDDDLVD